MALLCALYSPLQLIKIFLRFHFFSRSTFVINTQEPVIISLWICGENYGSVKVKLFLSKTWKHVGRWEVRLHTFVTSALHGSEWPASTLRPLYPPGKEQRHSLNKRAVGPTVCLLKAGPIDSRFVIRETWFVIVYLATVNLCLKLVDVSGEGTRGWKSGVK